MAHYAFLDEQNVVTEVIVGRNEWEVVQGITDWENYYSIIRGQKCVRTSYNGNIRKQYAGIGYTYDAKNDVFIAPQPYPSWTLNDTFDWVAPVPCPNPTYVWDEQNQIWVEPNE